MDKCVILDRLIKQLIEEVELARRASQDAASYATDEESKAKSQWDTQGLEASYLAAGQAGHAKEIVDAIQTLKSNYRDLVEPRKMGEIGALMGCEFNGAIDWYFLAPAGGGETLSIDGISITVITPRSPLFASLRRKTRGERIHLPSGAVLLVKSLE